MVRLVLGLIEVKGMYTYKIKKPKFYRDNSSGIVSCTFFVNGKEYYLPTSDYFKPTFLLEGCVPLDTEGEIDSALLAKADDLKPFLRRLDYLTTDPRIVRLAYIHFLENYYDRAKGGVVPDNLNLKELVEFWLLNKKDDEDYHSWVKVVRDILGVRVTD